MASSREIFRDEEDESQREEYRLGNTGTRGYPSYEGNVELGRNLRDMQWYLKDRMFRRPETPDFDNVKIPWEMCSHASSMSSTHGSLGQQNLQARSVVNYYQEGELTRECITPRVDSENIVYEPAVSPQILNQIHQRAVPSEYDVSYAENTFYKPPYTSTPADQGFLGHRGSPELSEPQIEQIASKNQEVYTNPPTLFQGRIADEQLSQISVDTHKYRDVKYMSDMGMSPESSPVKDRRRGVSPNKDSNVSPRPIVHMYHDSKAVERAESQSTSRNSCVSHDSQHENVAWYSSKKLHDVDANFEINANQSVMSHFVRERVPLGYLEQPQVSQASANVSELSVNEQSNARRTSYGQSNQKSVEPVTCEQNFAEQQGVSHESGYRNSNVHGWVINKESEQREPHDSLSSHERSRRSQYEREHREPPDSLSSTDEELDLPYIYWIPKMHKNPYKHRFIAGSSKCSTKPLSILLTKLLTHIKQGLQKYCETSYSRSGVNQMWILKNSKELLEHLQSPNFNHITSIKSFDFSTLYTTIPHQKLKSRLATIIRNSFIHKNGNRRYKFLVLGREGPYFVKEHSDSKNKYTEDDIINMLEFLVDNIFVVFGGKVFQQIVGIPMGTNCAPLLADIFLYSYEAEFIQSLLSTGKKKLASQFNFTYRYIDDVLSINNPDFANYLGQMYPAELEIKDTTESNTSASYLDLLLSIESDGQLRTSLYDKRDDFNFHITNFPFLSSNIPSSPAYGVFISQLIRYARACSSYECFILRAARLSSKLLGQGYVMERLKSSLRKFYGRYGDLIKHYEVSLSQMLHDILGHDHIQ